MTLDSLKTELERNNDEIDNYKKQNAEIDKYCELNSNDPTFLILVISVLFSRLLLLLQIFRFLGLKQKCEELPKSSEDQFYINLLQEEPFNFPDPSRMSFEALDDTLNSLTKKIDETQLHINDLNVKFLRIRAEKTWLLQENLHVVRASSLETSLGDLDKEQRYRRHLSREICGPKEDIKSNPSKKEKLINALKERIELNKRSIGVVSQKLNNISLKLRKAKELKPSELLVARKEKKSLMKQLEKYAQTLNSDEGVLKALGVKPQNNTSSSSFSFAEPGPTIFNASSGGPNASSSRSSSGGPNASSSRSSSGRANASSSSSALFSSSSSSSASSAGPDQ